jgi:hypothetical protein
MAQRVAQIISDRFSDWFCFKWTAISNKAQSMAAANCHLRRQFFLTAIAQLPSRTVSA